MHSENVFFWQTGKSLLKSKEKSENKLKPDPFFFFSITVSGAWLLHRATTGMCKLSCDFDFMFICKISVLHMNTDILGWLLNVNRTASAALL